jgi:hypothetical protein
MFGLTDLYLLEKWAVSSFLPRLSITFYVITADYGYKKTITGMFRSTG